MLSRLAPQIPPLGTAANSAPQVPVTLQLAQKSDPAGSGMAWSPRVVVSGQTTPGAIVRLGRGGSTATLGRTVANASGHFQFTTFCGMGTTALTAQAVDATGDRGNATMNVTRANQVVAWNAVALQIVRNAKIQAPDVARDLAIVQVAVFDAVDAIEPKYQPYAIATPASRRASPDAAAASAAYTALLGLFPQQKAVLDAEWNTSLAAIPGGAGKRAGVALGASVANQILALRSQDGSGAKVDYVPGKAPGQWQPTPPAYAPAVDPQWGQVTPFALNSSSQFLPPPPPALDSAQFAADYQQVKALGGTGSTVRTPDQTAAARFWSDLAGTFTPPGHWNQIAEIAAEANHSNLLDSARTFALLDIALADAGIAAWQTKYTYNEWRPVTAIRAGDAGLNPQLTADPTWTPLWSTPAFPSYISGHSTFSAAAAAVLDAVYGTSFSFTDPGDPTMGSTLRHFANFDQAAQEAGMSRIYGGIHYMADNIYGLQVGGEVGQYVLAKELRPLGTPRG